MSDTPETQLTDGSAVPEDNSHTELKANGQQEGYVVLSPEERTKGFVRPYRDRYIHVGKALRGELEMLNEPEKGFNGCKEYVAIDRFYIGKNRVGAYLTRSEVEQIKASGRYGGCGTLTTMSRSIAETYARDPKFYGATFCTGCGTHLPLDQFVWDGTEETVGS